jgi:hypothetical protein
MIYYLIVEKSTPADPRDDLDSKAGLAKRST